MLFSHPKDFTPVCTTELGEVARLKAEFERRNAKVIGLSVDPLADHRTWAGDIAETQGQAVNFPLLADPDRTVSNLYGMIHPNANDTLTVRSVFVIDPHKKVRLTVNSDDPAYFGGYIGENFRATRQALNLDRHDLHRLSANAIKAAFLDDAAKQRLQRELNDWQRG